MHRRIAAILLGVLLGFPVVVPVLAADPLPPASGAPSGEAAPTTAPTPEPTPEPSLTTPDPAPTASDLPVDATAGAAPSPATPTTPADAPPDPTGRFIVMLKAGSDTTAVVEKGRRRDGLKADRTFARAIHGFAAKLDKQQRVDLLADPNVVAVVPDGLIHLTQTTPTGVSRVDDLRNPIAKIDGVDQRVDADVAIVDTGITAVPDLNVAGGYNCSTADHTAWRDKENHGTHVAGIVGALDNSIGVVGVAPGARVWGVKILNDSGDGLISWYICGLDWILAQRDPNDASRPLFEAVNMSVTKYGTDDHNCGLTNNDALHQAICRVVAGGITVVAAAANDSHNAAANIPASYDEVITVSALADTDGLPGGLGGNRCYSWGGYDKDDTFADFSNYGGDVDLIAPGKCILSTIPGPAYAYMSGTSMAAPTVTGAVALYKASRPDATPAEVKAALRFLGNQNWAYWTDPDPVHEPLLDVSRIAGLGTFTLAATSSTPAVEGNSTATIQITINRSPTFFEPVRLSTTSLPDGWSAGPAITSGMGWGSTVRNLSVIVPKDTPAGAYDIGLQGTNQGRTVTMTVSVNVVADDPTAVAPVAALKVGWRMRLNATWADISWPAATDPTSAIAGYELQERVNNGSWGATIARPATVRSGTYLLGFGTTYRFRVRAMDVAGHWSPWVEATAPTVASPFDDQSRAVSRSAGWSRTGSSVAYHSTLSGSSRAGDTISLTFTGHGVAIVAPRNLQRGGARIYIDGTYVTTVFLWSRTSLSRQVVYAKSFAGGGRHRITLQVVGGGPHPNFQLDAFVVSS